MASKTKHALFDNLIEQHPHLGLKSDADIAKFLEVGAPHVSRMRHRLYHVTAEIIVKIHEKTGMTIKDIKALCV